MILLLLLLKRAQSIIPLQLELCLDSGQKLQQIVILVAVFLDKGAELLIIQFIHGLLNCSIYLCIEQ